MPTHTVAQGEHLSGIAEQYGFQNVTTIWNHASNAELKQLRKDPHILFPGDQVFIPPAQTKSDSAPTTKLSEFKITITLLRLNLKLQDINAEPIANQLITLAVEGNVKAPPTTDGEGKTTSIIGKSAKDAVLQVGELQFVLKIGHLDPVDKPSGAIARLNNLGYEAGDPVAQDGEIVSAVEEFQCDNKIPVTGTMDAATEAKLKEVHGC